MGTKPVRVVALAVLALVVAGLTVSRALAAPRLGNSFDAKAGGLVGLGWDPASQNVFVYAGFDTMIREYTPTGTVVDPSIPRPGAVSNDFDIDVADTDFIIGRAQTQIPAGSLLVVNGDDNPDTVYALNKDDGTILGSVPLQTNTSGAVGGAPHPGRDTFFLLDYSTGVVVEVDPSLGTAHRTFPIAPQGAPPMSDGAAFNVFYGDLDVHPSTGNIFVAGSRYQVVREFTADGAFVRDIDLTSLQLNGGMSGIAFDSDEDLWVSTNTGFVYEVVDLSSMSTPPKQCIDADSICTGDEDDEVQGTDADNFIFTAAGNDVINSGAGNDTVDAGAGEDEIASGPGKDHVMGGGGADRIFGDAQVVASGLRARSRSDSDDVLEGEGGRDVIYGEAGDDTLKGGGSNDILRGGPGVNLMQGGPGTDTCYGDKNDKFRGCERQRRSLG